VIKSALEIALERTKDVEVDKKGLAAREIADEGKRLIGKYLARDIDTKKLASAIGSRSKEEARWLKEGCFSVLSANLTLPQTEEFIERLTLLQEGFAAVTGEKRQVAQLFEQVGQFFQQYLSSQDQLIDALEKQFAPRMKEREAEMARQYGSAVKLSPQQDPEFVAALKQHLGRLEAQYAEALKQAKEQLNILFGKG
jgi:Family of unknown function (DUF6657)